MTDRQAKRDELLTRIDEIDRWQGQTKDKKMKEAMEKRKETLRKELEAL